MMNKQLGIRLPEETIQQLDALEKMLGLVGDRSSVIRIVVRQALASWSRDGLLHLPPAPDSKEKTHG